MNLLDVLTPRSVTTPLNARRVRFPSCQIDHGEERLPSQSHRADYKKEYAKKWRNENRAAFRLQVRRSHLRAKIRKLEAVNLDEYPEVEAKLIRARAELARLEAMKLR